MGRALAARGNGIQQLAINADVPFCCAFFAATALSLFEDVFWDRIFALCLMCDHICFVFEVAHATRALEQRDLSY
jgi:hypothetical protein